MTVRECADTFIQKTKKLYLDTRTQRNITRLQTDVQEVASIMTRNIADILGQGERMSGVHSSAVYAARSALFLNISVYVVLVCIRVAFLASSTTMYRFSVLHTSAGRHS